MARRTVWRQLGNVAALLLLALPGSAWALTSVEGTAIGDQGFYWVTPAEVWIFPHRLGNNDNEVMLQYGTPSTSLYNLYGSPRFDGSSTSIQTGVGGGFVVELINNFNLAVLFRDI